jgi:hypothetical protein
MKIWLQDLLKKILGNGFLVLLIIAVFYILYLRECKCPTPCPAQDEVIIKRDIWKDMIALADKPPVVTRETIRIKGDPVYIPTTPENPLPTPTQQTGDSIRTYSDSLFKKDINVRYTFKVKGTLIDRNWWYLPSLTVIKVDSLVFVPKLVNNPVKVVKNGLFLYGSAGGNKSSFLFGGGLDLITKKETLIGYEYQRYGNLNFHSVKFGGIIRIGK